MRAVRILSSTTIDKAWYNLFNALLVLATHKHPPLAHSLLSTHRTHLFILSVRHIGSGGPLSEEEREGLMPLEMWSLMSREWSFGLSHALACVLIAEILSSKQVGRGGGEERCLLFLFDVFLF